MKLRVKYFDVDTLENEVILHEEDCIELGVQELDRVKIISPRESLVAIVERTNSILERGEIGLMKDSLRGLKAKPGDEVIVTFSPKPESVRYIRKKMEREKLERDEINAIIDDIAKYRLSNIEISAWLTALYINGMTLEEIADMTNAMVKTGDVL
ncbi:MAG TPA: thymidine phosphorylase, partial [Candidatus Methanomethylophilaceae archaeon]|nr:thymidine phosphorylase [Candidatus Methanomethylophilaceae archaeon]